MSSRCSGTGCSEYEVQKFEISVFESEASLAAVLLAAVSRILLKHGILGFLFVDQHNGLDQRFKEYALCNVQAIHFEDDGKHFEGDVDAFARFKEHERLRSYLFKISHRFRVFLIFLLFSVTVCQIVILYLIAKYSGKINFVSAGDLVVSSAVQVAVLILCLNASSKISHMAQGIVPFASCKWHAYATCSRSSPIDSQIGSEYSIGNLKDTPQSSSSTDNLESYFQSLQDLKNPILTHTRLRRFLPNLAFAQRRRQSIAHSSAKGGH
ncbi:hypothetical protein Cni_G24374 [Canna indica]|uniref:Uncharacterized protein n=1 Tax=Canna indica TaxID=4628 RepID=A0AAQ3KYX9_9LILI|nr:hypothetical protein Cni_G24374 [Canna indica]